MTEQRYWRIWNWWSWVLALSVLVSQAIGVGVAWQASNTYERTRDSVIALVTSTVSWLFLRWLGGWWRGFADRHLMTERKAAAYVDEALEKGLLPKEYQRSPTRDRKVARTIRYDRKIGFTEAEIERDLEDFV